MQVLTPLYIETPIKTPFFDDISATTQPILILQTPSERKFYSLYLSKFWRMNSKKIHFRYKRINI